MPDSPPEDHSPHRWTFIRSGGVDQVVIQTGADVVNLEHLDQKLWVALACPTRGVELDPRTLDLIDADGDGRIRPPELIAVSRWVRERFADPDHLLRGGDRVPLEQIRSDTEAGRALADEARQLLATIGRDDEDSLSLADLDRRVEVLSQQGFNGDGVVPETAADDARTAALIQRIVDTVGGVVDRNGKTGIDADHAKRFFEQAAALRDWRAEAAGDEAILPLGDGSRGAAEAVNAVRAKVDDFFVRCRLAEFDPSAGDPLNPSRAEYEALHAELLDAGTRGVEQMPVAVAAPRRALPLGDGVNPAWADRVAALRDKAARPLLGKDVDELSEAAWREVKRRLAPCGDWLARRPDTRLDGIGADELDTLLDGDARERLDALIARDAEAGPSNERVVALEKMLRFQRDLVHLLNNFVSFSEFYSRRGAIFEAGVLYLDARSCQLAIEVANTGAHAKLAGLAKAYLAYCECTRHGKKKTIVAAFTAGDVDFLFVGRNGVFYDRKGDDWDATITRVIENPMSIRQAFFRPYKKFVRMVEELAAKRAAAGEQKSQGMLGDVATRATSAGQAPAGKADKAANAPNTRSRIDVGTVAALGVALGSISTVLVGIFANFIQLGWWIPVGVLGIVLAISGPSMLIAWLKLRQRSLGPLLDASGWAINGRMRINVPLGASLTRTGELPQGAQRRLDDPYRDRRRWRWAVLLLAAVAALAAWRFGWWERLLAAAGG